MPVIRISEDTWQRLKRWASPLEDTPDSTIGKLLDQVDKGLDPPSKGAAKQAGGTRLPRGKKTAEREFERPLLEALLSSAALV